MLTFKQQRTLYILYGSMCTYVHVHIHVQNIKNKYLKVRHFLFI